MRYRKEKDTMGTVQVPVDADYGPQTQRAVGNLPISGIRLQPVFIHSLVFIKNAPPKSMPNSGFCKTGCRKLFPGLPEKFWMCAKGR